MKIFAASAVLALLLAAAPLAHAQQATSLAERAGTVKVVQGDARVTDAKGERAVQPGDPVAPADTVSTGADSSASMVLRDGTTLVLGANSRVNLKDFAFNSTTQEGNLLVSVLRGSMRMLTGLIGMLTAILTSLNERRREMAILRSVGARPWHIASLLVLEAFALALAGVAFGVALLYLGIAGSQGLVQANYGLYLALNAPSGFEWKLLGSILAAAVAMGSVPAWRAYRQSLADGLSIRL